jgi:hypothetical protein
MLVERILPFLIKWSVKRRPVKKLTLWSVNVDQYGKHTDKMTPVEDVDNRFSRKSFLRSIFPFAIFIIDDKPLKLLPQR